MGKKYQIVKKHLFFLNMDPEHLHFYSSNTYQYLTEPGLYVSKILMWTVV